jgi:hypothetical protein
LGRGDVEDGAGAGACEDRDCGREQRAKVDHSAGIGREVCLFERDRFVWTKNSGLHRAGSWLILSAMKDEYA